MYRRDRISTYKLGWSTAVGWSCSACPFTQISKFHLWSVFLLWEWTQPSANTKFNVAPWVLCPLGGSGESSSPLPVGYSPLDTLSTCGWFSQGGQPLVRRFKGLKLAKAPSIGVHSQFFCLSVTDTNQAVWPAWSYVLAAKEGGRFFSPFFHTSTEGTKNIQKHRRHFGKFTTWLRKGQQRNLSLSALFHLYKTHC